MALKMTLDRVVLAGQALQQRHPGRQFATQVTHLPGCEARHTEQLGDCSCEAEVFLLSMNEHGLLDHEMDFKVGGEGQLVALP